MAIELKFIDQKSWQISPYLAEYLSVQEGEKIWLYAGADRRQVSVEVLPNYPYMSLYREWSSELRLTAGSYKVRRIQDGVRLGPIIGIVCQKLPSLAPKDSLWSHYFSKFEGGQLILMTPDGFDINQRCIIGFTLSSDKKEWILTEAPWPDALYIRTYPIDSSFQIFLQSEFKNRYFNSHTLFDKWTVYQFLSLSEDIKPHLPITAVLEDSPEQLNQWVNQYSAVYLKPPLGNKGKGIMKITLAHPDSFASHRIRYRENMENIELTLPSVFPIHNLLKLVMGKHPYLIQQAIAIPLKNDKVQDFRVHLQKKDDGQWHLTGLSGRQSEAGSIVTNLYNGGKRIHLSTFIQDDSQSKSELFKEIKTLCLNTAFILEQHYGMLGELGFDLCLDQENHLWLLEVNALPGKVLFTELYSPSVEQNVYSAPLLYASYLSGFSEVINPMV